MGGNPEKIPVSSAAQHLCHELVELAILPRLPVKALMRLKCVSRHWNGFISKPCPRFIYLQSLHAASCILERRVAEPICLSRDPRSVGIPSIDKQIKPHVEFLRCVRIVASCNGLLCCHLGWNIAIGNPSMNNWKMISLKLPDPLQMISYRGDGCAYGLAVDVESSVRYTLLLLIMHNNYLSDIFVFSSTTEQWSVIRDKRLLPVGAYLDNDQVAVYVEGCLYWMVEIDTDGYYRRWESKTDCGVLWFNIGNNLYGLHPLPDVSDYPMRGRLGEYGGKISYAVIKAGGIHIWSLDHQGWSKKFSIILDILANADYQRIIYFDGGDLSFFTSRSVYSLDTLAGTLDTLADRYYLNDWVSCRNTLVRLPFKRRLPFERQNNETKSTIRWKLMKRHNHTGRRI